MQNVAWAESMYTSMKRWHFNQALELGVHYQVGEAEGTCWRMGLLVSGETLIFSPAWGNEANKDQGQGGSDIPCHFPPGHASPA